MALANEPRTTIVQLGRKSSIETGSINIMGTYKTRFMTVVLVKRGPSLVGKLHVVKIPP